MFHGLNNLSPKYVFQLKQTLSSFLKNDLFLKLPFEIIQAVNSVKISFLKLVNGKNSVVDAKSSFLNFHSFSQQV